MKILVTGGAGFIGSNFIRHVLRKYPEDEIINLDKLTYCGNLDNLKDVEEDPRYAFKMGDVCDAGVVQERMEGCDAVVHFAAETHVDRSIMEAGSFVVTDVFGTYTVLEAAKSLGVKKVVHIGTDESYGSVDKGAFGEDDRLDPSSPYSASKASADLIARAYWVTYGVPVTITRSSNNFGPYQYPEKLIPLFITNAIEERPLPLYGDGQNVRDWIYVLDNCDGVDFVLRNGEPGEIYNIGGGNEKNNLEITEAILENLGKDRQLIEFVSDRAGHDKRYALDIRKVEDLGWRPKADFETALAETIDWYRENEWWWKKIKSGEFRKYYEKLYKT
ncbi:MAG: dTDP-glucose 4,6-dehydratase [Terriglobia bacterium]